MQLLLSPIPEYDVFVGVPCCFVVLFYVSVVFLIINVQCITKEEGESLGRSASSSLFFFFFFFF